MGRALGWRTIAAGPTFVRVIIAAGFVISVILPLGCTPSYEVHVPADFMVSENVNDLRQSLVSEEGATSRKVKIVPHESESSLFIEICNTGDGQCRELAFVENGLDRSIDEIIDILGNRVGVERIVIVTDYQRRSVCERFETAADAGDDPGSSFLPVLCMSQARDEMLDDFVDAADATIDITSDLVITILGDGSVNLIQRLGVSEEGAPEEGGGVVPELFLPAAGRRLRAVGYPVPASIAYDFAAIIPTTATNGGDSTVVYVPIAVFRY